MSTLVNKACFVTTLVNTRYSLYRLIDLRFTTKHNLQCIPIYLQRVTGYNALLGDKITEVAVILIDINRHSKEQAFAYIVPWLALYDMILGIVQVKKQRVLVNSSKSEYMIALTGTIIQNRAKVKDLEVDYIVVSAVSFGQLTHSKRQKKAEVFTTSIVDINKALLSKVRTDPRTKLPEQCQDFLDVFSKEKATELLLLRGTGVDYKIQLEKVDSKEPRVL